MVLAILWLQEKREPSMEVSCPFTQNTGYCHSICRTSEAQAQQRNHCPRAYNRLDGYLMIPYPRPLAQCHILGLYTFLISSLGFSIGCHQCWSCEL